MHNNIMAAGSRDRPPMLATGRYAQWRSRFLRYIDTRPNGDALRKCILEGPYTPTTVVIPAVPATENSPAIPEQTTVETVLNMSPANKAHFESEKEAIHLILTGIGDEIYSTVDACKTAHEMWEAIERLQQGESLNIQDVKTNLFWEFGQFTSHDGETIESYYTRFYKMMNEMIRNNLTVATMQVNLLMKKDKEMPKILALIAKYFKKLYKPTNNNLRTSSNTRNKYVDTTPRYKNDNQTVQFGNQRTVKVVRARDTVDTDEEIDEQELEAHYSYMAKIQEVPNADSCTDCEPLEQVQYDTGYNVFANEIQHSEQSKSISNTCVVETGDSNVIPDSLNMCDNDIQNDQNDVECDDERVALANLIANLKLDVDENKKIQKQLKKANTTLAHELTECKSILAETSRTLEESNSIRDSCLVVLQNKQIELEKYMAFNDHIVDYGKLRPKLNETLGLLAQKNIDIKEGLKHKAYEISIVQEKHDELVKQSLLTKSHYEGLVKEKTKGCANTSQVKFKKTEVEDHHRISSISNKTKSVTACNDSLKSKTSNVNAVCATCGKCLYNSDHYACVSKFLNDVHARTKKPKNSKSYYRTLYEKTSKAWKWWIEQQCPSGYKCVPKTKMKWVPKVRNENVKKRVSFAIDNASRIINIVQLILFIVDSRFIKHMTGNLKLLCNFVEKYLGTVHFGNNQFALILGYGDLVAFRKSTCFVRDLQGNDLLATSPTQAWLWHRRLSHLNFDYINLLSKKNVVIGLPTLKYVKDQLCSSGDDETPEVLKDFLTMIKRNLQALVISVQTDRGTEFLNKTLNAFFKEEGIEHQTSTPRTPEQKDVVERRNPTLVEAARTMLSAS
ncbi:retrovirus-related pol polyprotein from transposon TNT 1-94 [Tanacetum coccineum]